MEEKETEAFAAKINNMLPGAGFSNMPIPVCTAICRAIWVDERWKKGDIRNLIPVDKVMSSEPVLSGRMNETDAVKDAEGICAGIIYYNIESPGSCTLYGELDKKIDIGKYGISVKEMVKITRKLQAMATECPDFAAAVQKIFGKMKKAEKKEPEPER